MTQRIFDIAKTDYLQNIFIERGDKNLMWNILNETLLQFITMIIKRICCINYNNYGTYID